MVITLNIIEAENTVWITDENDPLGVEPPCSNREELVAALDKYTEHFCPAFGDDT